MTPNQRIEWRYRPFSSRAAVDLWQHLGEVDRSLAAALKARGGTHDTWVRWEALVAGQKVSGSLAKVETFVWSKHPEGMPDTLSGFVVGTPSPIAEVHYPRNIGDYLVVSADVSRLGVLQLSSDFKLSGALPTQSPTQPSPRTVAGSRARDTDDGFVRRHPVLVLLVIPIIAALVVGIVQVLIPAINPSHSTGSPSNPASSSAPSPTVTK